MAISNDFYGTVPKRTTRPITLPIAQRLDEKQYRILIRYQQDDETEVVIRVLSFGPFVKVTEPESFVELIKSRLKMQKKL